MADKFPLGELVQLYDNTVMVFNNYNNVQGFAAFCRRATIESIGDLETAFLDRLVEKEHYPLEGYTFVCNSVSGSSKAAPASVHLYLSDTIPSIVSMPMISSFYEVPDTNIIVMPKKDFLFERSSGEMAKVFEAYVGLFSAYIKTILETDFIAPKHTAIAYIFATMFFDSMLEYKPRKFDINDGSGGIISYDIIHDRYVTWKNSSDGVNFGENAGCIGAFSVRNLGKFIDETLQRAIYINQLDKFTGR